MHTFGPNLDQLQEYALEIPIIIFNICIGLLTLDPVILYSELFNILLILFKLLIGLASTALFKIKK
jgi:hypothetical protein